MRFSLIFFLALSFPIQSLYSSMARLEDYPFNDLKVFKKTENPIISFFEKTACRFGNYSVPINNQTHRFRSCSIDFSSLKDKKNEILDYIKNPKNWSEKYLHSSLFKRYHSYKDRRFFVDNNRLIIYVLQDALLFKILENSKGPYSPLSLSDLKFDKIPKDKLFNKGYSIRVQDSRLNKLLKSFYNAKAIDPLFEVYEDQKSFKNIFFSYLDIPFETYNSIIYSSGFDLSSKSKNKTPRNQNQPLSSDLNSDQNQPSKENIPAFDIHILEFSSNKNKVMQSLILLSITKGLCSPLEKKQVDESQIPQGHLFDYGCSIRVQDHRLKANASLAQSFYQPDLIDTLFNQKRDLFKKDFIKNLNLKIAQTQPKHKLFDIHKAIVYSSGFDLSPKTPAADSINPKLQASSDGAFDIHIIITKDPLSDLKNLLLKKVLNEYCKPLLNSNSLPNALPNELLFFKGCKMSIPFISQDLNQTRLKIIFDNLLFKQQLIQKVNENPNNNLKNPYPDYSLIDLSSLKNNGSFDIFIVQTRNKVKKILRRNLSRYEKDFESKLLRQLNWRNDCFMISEKKLQDIFKINLNLSADDFIPEACQIILITPKLGEIDFFDLHKIKKILSDDLKKKILDAIRLKNASLFKTLDPVFYPSLNRIDGLLTISIYKNQNKKEAFREIILEDASQNPLSDRDKRLLEDYLKSNAQLDALNDFVSHASKITVQDHLLNSESALNPLVTPIDIKNLFKDTRFKEDVLNRISHSHLALAAAVFIKITNQKTGEFEIYFYKTEKKLEALKKIILEDASSSEDLNRSKRNALESEVTISGIDFISKAVLLKVQDDQLQASGPLKDFIKNPNKIEALLNEAGFKQELINIIKRDHPTISDQDKVFSKITNTNDGEFEIYFYQTEKKLEALKKIILEDASSSEDLNRNKRNALESQVTISGIDFISKAVLFKVQDDQLQAAGPLKDFIENPNKIEALLNEAEFKQELINIIKRDHPQVSNDAKVFSKITNTNDGEFEIYFYQTEKKLEALKKIILEDASSSADLNRSKRNALESEVRISENDFISKAVLFKVQDDQLQAAGPLKDFIENPNKIEALLNEAGFKQELINIIKRDYPQVSDDDKVFIKITNTNDGDFEIYFYQTEKKLEALKKIILEDASPSADLNRNKRNALESQVRVSGNNFISKAVLFSVKDDQLQAAGLLKDFIVNPNKIEALLNEAGFKQELINIIKRDHPTISDDAKVFIKITNENDGDFEIYFYKIENKLEAFKKIILEDARSSVDLNPNKRNALESQVRVSGNNFISKAVLLRVQDDLLKADGPLNSFINSRQKITNVFTYPKYFKQKVINIIRRDHSQIRNDDMFFIKITNANDGEFEIYFYKIENKIAAVKKIILEDTSSLEDLTDSNKQVIENQADFDQENIVSQGLKIKVQDDQLQAGSVLNSFLNSSQDINALFSDSSDFKQNLIYTIKRDHPQLSYDDKVFIKITNTNNGEFEIYFYKTAKKLEAFKKIILEDASSSEDLTDSDKQEIENQADFDQENIVSQGLKITVQDYHLKAAGSLSKMNALFRDSSDFKQKVIDIIKRDHPQVSYDDKVFIKITNTNDGDFEIYFYKTEKKLEALKKIILEDTSSSEDLTDSEKQEVENQAEFDQGNIVSQGLKIKVQDDQLQADGPLSNLFNSQDINALFSDSSDFKQKVIDIIKRDHPQVSDDAKVFSKITNANNGEFEIYLYEILNKKEEVKKIILENIVSATPLSVADRILIQYARGFDRKNPIHQGFKIRIKDDQLKPDGPLSSVFNKKTVDGFFNEDLFIHNIQSHMERNNKKLYGKARGVVKYTNQAQGEAEIFIYSTENTGSKSLRELIINNLAYCRVLNNSEIDVLKADPKMYDSKYISNACQIDIKDNFLKTKTKSEIENLFDIYFKQEIADRLNKPSLNLDKHMSVYLKVKDITQGRIRVILAETKQKKKPALIGALDAFKHLRNNKIRSLDLENIEKAYGVKYIHLGISFYWENKLFNRGWEGNRFNRGWEFDKSFALIDEILKDPKRRTDWINIANEIRRNQFKIQQEIPNASNTIIRSRRLWSETFVTDVFALTESPELAIKADILDNIDKSIVKPSKYEFIRSSDAIKDFEAGRSLKQGLLIKKVIPISYGDRRESLSSYYDNREAMNKLLDDADFKRKVLGKINAYFKNKQFSRDNLENIKIKVQDSETWDMLDLVIYELELK